MKDNQRIYTQNLDYYWRTLAVYLILLIFSSVIFGSVQSESLTVSFTHPVVILLSAIVIYVAIDFVYRKWSNLKIILTDETINLKTRFGEKSYLIDDVKNINFINRKFRNKNFVKLIKVQINNRRRNLRINPTKFELDDEIIESFREIKKKIKK